MEGGSNHRGTTTNRTTGTSLAGDIRLRPGMPLRQARFRVHPKGKGRAMAILEANKRAVLEYYELAFNEGKPEEAVEKYLGDRYIQHNPQAADGAEAFIGFVNWYRGEYPQLPSRSSGRWPRETSWSPTA